MPATRVLGVIPARLASTRLPRKVLRLIAGRPMIEWVWQAAADSAAIDRLVLATDSAEVADFCHSRGIEAILTSPACASGSDRVYEVSRQIDAEIFVNIQGDEPLLTPGHFRPMLALFDRAEVQVATVAVPCPAHDIANPNAVKVVTAADGRALYFSRSTIPYDRDQAGFSGYRKHLGLYAYRKAVLEQFAALPPSPLEQIERLEQLRLLENGIEIHVATVNGDTIGVDTEEDLKRVEALLQAAKR
jgi:3-deoxy-manno-octulosonate cytidylyltransferase (CMP-KDO synthetase)